jgi:signal transduction histidine kinase
VTNSRPRGMTRVSRLDAALVLVVAVSTIVGTSILKGRGAVSPLAYAVLLGAALSLLAWREFPRASLLGTIVFASAYEILDFPGGFYTIPLGIAFFSVVDAGLRRTAVAASVLVIGGFLAVGLATGRGHISDLGNALWFGGWLVASLVLGEVTRGRRAYVAEVQQRALAAERGREEEARRRAGEERIRIARELHDILGHRISLINVQASAAVHLLDHDPEQSRAALVAIKQASHEALGEVRATLGILRQINEPEPVAPVPSLAELDAVIAETSAAGLDVRLEVRGQTRSLPAGVDLAAYRIIQESLTNVVRHARATSAQVSIAYSPADVEIEVIDDGVQPVPPGRAGIGSGLIGMRERTMALGGELDASPRPGGGFRVRARLPTGGVA